jgi:rod shape-determining protein MreC
VPDGQRMALPDIRNRARLLFVAVMVGHTLLISAQVNSRRGVSLLQDTFTTVVVEAQRAAWAVVDGVRDVWRAYAALRGVRAENDRLMDEVTQLRVRLQQEQALSRGTEHLRSLLDLRTRTVWQTTGAEVIAGSTSPAFRSITIDKGHEAGVRTDMAVVAATGVVGRVVDPATRAASVQLLIDRNAAVSVLIERSRAQGIAVGNGDGTLSLEYVAAVADVKADDLVVTAGLDGVYPKGLPVGRVTVVERAGSSYRRVIVVPLVDFSSLEAVLVVLSPPPAPTPLAREETW